MTVSVDSSFHGSIGTDVQKSDTENTKYIIVTLTSASSYFLRVPISPLLSRSRASVDTTSTVSEWFLAVVSWVSKHVRIKMVRGESDHGWEWPGGRKQEWSGEEVRAVRPLLIHSCPRIPSSAQLIYEMDNSLVKPFPHSGTHLLTLSFIHSISIFFTLLLTHAPSPSL